MRDWYHIKRRYVVSFEGEEVEFLSHFRPGVYLLKEAAEEALVKAGHHPGGWDDFEIRKAGRSLRAPFHLKGENMAKTNGEKNMGIKLNGENVCISGTLPGMTRNEAFIRLKAVGGVPCERLTKRVTLMVVASNAGKSKRGKLEKAIADGQEVRVIDGHEFLEALKEAEREQVERAIEQAAKRKGAKVDVKVHHEEGGVQAIEMTPKKEDDAMKKQIEELEAKLKAMGAELEQVWKENAMLKAAKPKEAPQAPKAPSKKAQETAAAVSLEQMQAWCEGKGLKAKQTNEASSIWVLGPSKPYKDELIEMGARWGVSKKYGKGWYINPSAA